MTACPHPEKQRHRSRAAALNWHLGHKRKNPLPGWARRGGLNRLGGKP